ncbi:hypothetical protein KUCAC02_022973 [Chaenocephalus aceratus]|uniref:Uncharacterized protein n=1 Tax=Chaenocephalus aceratus TaxID=36190 RepID=A0ACB9XPA8_CHAAC|nr:hypothetical protein KUCAC02_022973 [Chaenocephalus aceratus]
MCLGMGEYVLAATLRFPQWYNPRRKTAKTSCRRHSKEALIIAICLLMLGDIHQCPGPTSNEASFADSVTCNSTSLHLCSINYRQTHLVQPAPSLSTTEDPAVLQLQYPDTGLWWPNEGDPAGRPLPPSNTDKPEVIQRRLFTKQLRFFTIQWQQSKEVDRYPESNIPWREGEQSSLLVESLPAATCELSPFPGLDDLFSLTQLILPLKRPFHTGLRKQVCTQK